MEKKKIHLNGYFLVYIQVCFAPKYLYPFKPVALIKDSFLFPSFLVPVLPINVWLNVESKLVSKQQFLKCKQDAFYEFAKALSINRGKSRQVLLWT